MGLRGPKPKGKVKIKWSPQFAYAIGLLVTDGNLSPDGRHITFVSKDKEQLSNLKKALNIEVPVSHTRSGYTGRLTPRIQFSDSSFWSYLNDIGVTPNKSKTIGAIDVPNNYFMDFVRGLFDGDGSFYSYFDSRWKSSFMFYVSFVSASSNHIAWLRQRLMEHSDVKGHITHGEGVSVYQLKYAKSESLKILKNMYYSDSVICLSRKRKKIEKALSH
jgi:hypothetical protein